MLLKKLLLFLFLLSLSWNLNAQTKKLNVIIAGLSHDMVYEILNSYRNGDLNIVAIAESDKELAERYRRIYNFPADIIYSNLTDALKSKKPDVILAYSTTSEHINIVEIAAPMGLPIMVEKPLCLNNEEAERIAFLAKKYKINVFTNYENSWFPGNQEVYKEVKLENKIGPIVKMVSLDGHAGPKASKVSKEFFNWLNDPAKSGGGALYDFGCYGANLMTWMMDGEVPLSVKAETHHLKADIYPNVDDEATIILEYPTATGVVKASWNLPGVYTGFEVVGKSDSIQTASKIFIRGRKEDTKQYGVYRAKELVESKASYLGYLISMLNGEMVPKNDLPSLENNIIVMKILVAAKESAKTGQKILLQ